MIKWSYCTEYFDALWRWLLIYPKRFLIFANKTGEIDL